MEKEAVEALLEGIIPEQINHLHKIINQIRMQMDHYSRGKTSTTRDEHLLRLLDNHFGRKGQTRKTNGAFDLWVISDHNTFNNIKLEPLVKGDYMGMTDFLRD